MRSSILIVLAVGFAGFGALEVAALNPDDGKTITGPAQDHSSEAMPDETPVTAEPVAKASIGTDQSCLTPALVAAFQPRHLELLDRAAKLDRREAELEDLEANLKARLSGMAQTRDELQAMTERLDVVAGEDITHLVQMYSTMKAKKAAAIFDKMDPAFAAGFLREIDSARAGMIMAEMGEDQSYRVSLLIANRHAEWRNKR
ncbi:MotE family protein [Algimonas porphyrae]|uniref:Magnesium transporter MgtE intracellular domain-containing protein n=1 Tax=Algimonas porphyrae TaxID=1128113 RepID=A0ABQ5V458_9PROT|nr:hypothetical protein [Algimonas porphyrae]GLQ21455.1 hypothetical protein GCM10007854_24100 [Algimonas porphyrae]